MTFFMFFKGYEEEDTSPPAIGYPGPIVQNPQLKRVKKKRSKKEIEQMMMRRARSRREEEEFFLFLLETLDDDPENSN